jgi:hypothetical protein
MKNQNKKIRENILNEISNSKMSFKRKMKMLKLMDVAFRNTLGVFYLSNKELVENDILNRSM